MYIPKLPDFNEAWYPTRVTEVKNVSKDETTYVDFTGGDKTGSMPAMRMKFVDAN